MDQISEAQEVDSEATLGFQSADYRNCSTCPSPSKALVSRRPLIQKRCFVAVASAAS